MQQVCTSDKLKWMHQQTLEILVETVETVDIVDIIVI